jgi:hypothetical protein
VSEGDRTLGVRAGAHARTAARTASTPADLAWLLLVPCGLVLVGAIVLLGPPLADLLFPPPDIAFWPTATPTLAIRPEPDEQARFLLALAGPVALSGLLLALRARPLPLRPPTVVLLVQASQVLLAALVLAAVVAQQRLVYDATYSGTEPFRRVYFTPATLVVAALLTVAMVVVLRREALTTRIAALVRETRGRRLAALGAVALLLGLWLLTAVNTEGSIANANLGVYGIAPFWLGEAYAVLNGRPPLVDVHAQYSQLWPYLSAGVMKLAGENTGVYVATMVAGSAAGLLAVFAILRRLVASSLLALALFLPFLATSFFMQLGPLEDRYGPSNLFSMFPMRYAGPYLLAWLIVRHLAGARPLRRPLLFLAGGLVLINNAEFGLAAFGGLVAALLWTDTRPPWPRILRVLRDAALGLAGAVLLTCLLTLVVAGALPDFSHLFTFARLWGIGGVTMLPMPAFGFHVAVYVTFAATIVVATVRALSGAGDRGLTALLVWAGVFGLGASGYFAGRSHPEVLINLFSAWAFALGLLTIVVVRAILARPSRRPAVAEVAVLAGLGLAICSIAQTPEPLAQLDRIATTTSEIPYRVGATTAFVAAGTARPDEPVVILAPMGHRVAYELGLVNVAPYVSMLSMPAERQLQETIDALRDAGGRTMFLFLGQALPPQLDALAAAGFETVRRDAEYVELRDAR